MKIRPGEAAMCASRSNSLVVRWTGSSSISHFAMCHVDRDAVEGELFAPLWLFRLTPVTPQDSLDARQQLRTAEWLGDVVVCADLEPDDAIDLVALGRQDDHRGGHPLASQDAENLHAAHAWQHHVEQDQVESLVARGLEGRLAVRGGRDLVALPGQIEGQRLA